MKTFKLYFTLLMLSCAGIAQAQLANVTYSVRMNSLVSHATCATHAQISPRAYLYFSDNANGAESSTFHEVNGTRTFSGPGAVAHTRTNGASLINTRIYAWEENTGSNTAYEPTWTLNPTPDNCLYQLTQNSVVNFRNSAAPSNGTYSNTGSLGSSSSPGNIWTVGYTWRYAAGGSTLNPSFSCDDGATAPTTAYSSGQIPSWTVNMTAGLTYRFITSTAVEVRLYNTNGYSLITTVANGTAGLTYTAPSTGAYFIELTGGAGRTLVGSNGTLRFFQKNADVAGNSTVASNTSMYGVYNFTGDFVLNPGVTITVPQAGCPLVINAANITISGTINADGAGNAGGNGGGGGGSSGGAGGGTNATGGGGGQAGFGPGGGNAGSAGNNATGGRSIDCGSACVDGDDASRSGAAGGAGGSGGSYGGVGGTGGFSASGRPSGIGSTGTPGSWVSGPGGKAAYGTAANTSDLALGSGGGGGGGGGGGFSGGSGAGAGGRGGGAVNLNASGNLAVSGVITANGLGGANGGNGGVRSGGGNWNCSSCSNPCGGGANDCRNADNCGVCCYYTWAGPGGGGGGAGGGSGGGIKLQAYGNMNVTGTVRANGGNGGNAGRPWQNLDGNCNDYANGGGSGSGGVIKYVYNPCASNNFGGTVQVNAGAVGTDGRGLAASNSGQSGTFLGPNSNIYHPSYNPGAVSLSISGATNVCQGGSVTLTANLSGGQSSPPNFEWFRNGVPVGGNSSTYTTDASLPVNNYTYTVRSCNVTSSGVAVNVVADPTVTISGAADACEGGSVTLSAAVSGGVGSVTTYTWTRNSSPVGPNSSTYTTDNTLGAASYVYNVIVTQSGSGCQSTATPVSANVIPDPVVTISGAADVCVGGTVNLTANSSGGLTAPTYSWTRNGSPVGSNSSSYTTANSLSAGNYNYAVSVSAGNGCNATSSSVAANVVADPVVSISGAANVCEGNSVNLTANVSGGLGSISSYSWTRDGNPVGTNSGSYTTSNALTPGSYNYVVSVTQNISGCAGTSPSVATTVYEIPNATFSSTNVTCVGGADGTITMFGSGGTGPYQYSIGGVTYQSSNVFSGLTVGTYQLYVKDVNECFRHVGSVTLTQVDAIPPTAICLTTLNLPLNSSGSASLSPASIDNGSFDNCSIANYAIDISSFDCSDVGNNTVTLTVTDPDGNSASCATTVVVQDVTAPNAICQNAYVALDINGLGSIVPGDVNNGSNDACGIASITVTPSNFDCGNAGQLVPVILTVTDINGLVSTCGAFVEVEDVDIPGEAPRVSCEVSITVSLESTGTVTISPAAIATDSYDNCGLTLSISQNSFSCADVGFPVTVTLFGTDNAGNVASCTTEVNIIDDLAPDPVCPDAFAYLDYDGYAYLSAWDMGFLSTDNCGIADITASQEEFFCDNLGYNEVELTFTDIFNNVSNCIVVVWVEDYEVPELYCQDITVELDADGYAIITFDDIDAGSYDNCGIIEFYFTQEEFTCDEAGTEVYVYVEGYDEYYNAGYCEVFITVVDLVAPDAVCQDISIQLDEFGFASISEFDIDGGSTDACGIDFMEASQLDFDCSHVGDNSVTLSVTDIWGNVGTCDATVTVEDVTAPEIISCAFDISVFNDPGECGATILIDEVVADDACGIASITNDYNGLADATDFYPVGVTVVEFTVTDVNGNSSNCSITVEVEDNEPPVITACPTDKIRPAATNRCWALVTIEAPLASDNCGIASIVNDFNGTSNASGQYNVGITVVEWTVTDIYGNFSTCETVILVIDNQPPVAVCDDITVQLNNSGLAVITADDIDGGSTDNCTIIARNLSTSVLTCSNVGVTPVTMTVIDNSGNFASCVAQVTVEDNVAPVANCQDIVVFLDANGQRVVNASQVNNGSTDACGIASLSLDNNSFTCADLGDNDVVLTVTDVNGNSSSCDAVVTILDITNPTAVCNNFTAQLDETGNVTVTPEDFSSASTDNCEITTRFVNPSSFTCADIGTETVTVILIDQSGNTAFCFPVVTVEDNVAPVAVCQDTVEVYLDADGLGSTTAEAVENGSTDACGIAGLSLSQTAFDCSHVGDNTVTLSVTDINGNVGTCDAIVAVLDTIEPIALCQDVTVQLDANGLGSTTPQDVDNGSNDACGIASLALSQSDFDCSHVGDNTVTLTVIDNNGNVSTCDATVTVEDNVAPQAYCQDITVQLDANGVVFTSASAINNGSFDACGIATLEITIEDFECIEVGPNTVYLIVTDVNGNVGYCEATVTVEDNVAPVAICQNVTVQLDANGNGTTTPEAVDNGSNDACGIASLALNQTNFNCSHVGSANLVTLTVTDVNGNSSTCVAGVNVEDNVAPEAICQDVTVQLNAAGNGSTTAAAVNNGSNDACGIASISLSQTSFDCSHVGGNPVTLTVTDVNGNVSTCSATVTVEDNVNPVALCQNVTVQLDANGVGSTTAAAVNNGSSDACGIASLSLSQTDFNCSHVGNVSVELTVTDNNGNSSSCFATVTVEDNVAPVALCQDVTVQLDANGNGSTSAAAVDNGSNDACGIASLVLSQTNFACANVGANPVTLTVTDNNGNMSSCSATVTVEDNVAPVALCQDVVAALDVTGNVYVAPTSVDNGSSDACGIASLVLSQTNFDCDHVGDNLVTLTVTDNNGNVSTCDAIVTVEDNVEPDAQCQDVTIFLNDYGDAILSPMAVNNNSMDACGILPQCPPGAPVGSCLSGFALDKTFFSCSDVGSGNVVTLTVTDENNNSSSCTAVITVIDNVAPEALCQDVTIYLDADGNASTTPEDVDNGSNDACGIASLALSQTDFDCSHVGGNAVTLTVTDVNGNVSSCGATVTVIDEVDPIALCQDVTVQLDAGGNGSTTAAAVNNGSNDACGVASILLSQTNFSCANVGDNTVTLTVIDVNGNSSTCTATVTVEDNVDPVAICQNLLIQLDADGNASITPEEVNNGSNDACGIASLSLSQTDFDCSHVGGNGVTLTVTDNNGNSSSCNAIVAVQDNVAPVALCQDVTVQLDASGNGSTTAAAVDNGSNDACGIASLVLSKTTFNCSNVGANPVTLTVTDVNGNVSTCGATVTVEDNVAPVAICQDVTLTLSNGLASITPADVNNGSNDACGIASLSVDEDSWTCADIGQHVVTLTVTDVNGNSSSCVAMVDILGTVPEVSISSSVLPTFCQGAQIILTASPSEPVSFDWSPGGESTASIDVYATGTYTVEVTNVNGCTATESFFVNYDASALASAYVLLGYEEVHLHNNTVVLSGGVGVNTPHGKAKVEGSSQITATGTFLKSPSIEIKGGAAVTTQILGAANIVLPDFVNNNYASNAGINVNVPNNATVTLADSVYRNISIGKNATVTFTRPNIYIQSISVKEGATVKFNGCANLMIAKSIDFEKNSRFNLEGNGVTLYVGDEDKNNAKKVVEFDEGVVFTGRIYATQGEIKSAKGKANNPVILTGQFLGRKIHFDGHVRVNWDTNCNPACSPDPVPVCVCNGGLKKLVVEYSLWDDNSPELTTMTVYSNAALTNVIASFTNVAPGGSYTITAPGGSNTPFGPFIYVQLSANPSQVIAIPTTCEADIVGEFFRELYVYSQTDINKKVCSSTDACGPGRTLMCHSPKNKTPHTHCVKNKDVAKKLEAKKGKPSDWTLGDCSAVQPVGCAKPKKGLVNVTIQYTGSSPATIVAYRESNKSVVLGTYNVNPGDVFTVSGTPKLKANTYFSVNGGPLCAIHTSGSQQIVGFSTCGMTVVGWTDGEGNVCGSAPSARTTIVPEQPATIEEPRQIIQLGTVELDAAPNPFTQSTMIRFRTPGDDYVRLVVFGVTGQEIDRLYEGQVEGGREYRFNFQAGNNAPGMYFYRLETGDGKVHVKKLIISK